MKNLTWRAFCENILNGLEQLTIFCLTGFECASSLLQSLDYLLKSVFRHSPVPRGDAVLFLDFWSIPAANKENLRENINNRVELFW